MARHIQSVSKFGNAPVSHILRSGVPLRATSTGFALGKVVRNYSSQVESLHGIMYAGDASACIQHAITDAWLWSITGAKAATWSAALHECRKFANSCCKLFESEKERKASAARNSTTCDEVRFNELLHCYSSSSSYDSSCGLDTAADGSTRLSPACTAHSSSRTGFTVARATDFFMNDNRAVAAPASFFIAR